MGAFLLCATTARALPHDSLGAGKQAEWQRLAPGLQEDARQALSPAFGGLWIDNSDGGRIKLAIVDSSPTLLAQVEGVIARSGLTGAVDVVRVPRTEKQLTQILNQLAARLSLANEGSSTPLTVGIRPDQNTVRVSTPDEVELTPPQQQLLTEASQRYGPAISIGVYQGKIRPEACSYPFCPPPLRAGVKIGPASSFFGEPAEGLCTGAFLARGKEDGKMYQLTAGHCGSGTETWGSRPGSSKEAWKEIGTWSKSSITEAGDFGMYQVSNDSFWQARPWVYWAGSNDEYPISSDADVVKGQQVCKSGAFYGTTSCGEVTEVSVVVEFNYGPPLGVKKVKVSRAKYCSIPGDSGSPVHYNGVAYGIHTGGSGECNKYFSSVRAAEEGLNVDVLHRQQYLLRNTNSEGSPDLSFQHGVSGEIPISGDWDNDGDTTIGLYRPSNRTFYLRNTNSEGSPDLEFQYGLLPATPIVGDWDGNGTETIGLYSSIEANPYVWALNNANDESGADYYFTWGTKGDIPIVGDWDNDGDTTIGLYRPSNRTFYLRNTNSEGSPDLEFQYGLLPATPIVGDWDGNGTETIGLYSSIEANPYVWALNNANDESGADYYFTWGAKGNEPIVGDWDGDGDTTVGLFRPFGPTVPNVETKAASGVTLTGATLKGDVNPNASETTHQFEYGTTNEYGSKVPAAPKSIGSGTSPVEVAEAIEGLTPNTTYHFRVVATNAEGTTKGKDQTFTTLAWKIVSTPNPEGASDSNLYDVSCEPSTNVCTSVGKSTKSGVDNPVAQRWNGTSWSEQTAAKKAGSTHNRLLGIDCPSETRCIAVGDYQNSEGGPATLGELWNENKWNVQTTPVPAEATSSELVAVGCNSTANCRAGGSAVIKGVKTAIVEKWVSPTWSLETIPIPEGAKSSQLDGVDCLFSNFCAAVGRYTTSGGSVKSLVMFWNGEWKLHTATDPEGAVESTLLDVSCTPTPNRCTAVGGWKNSEGEQFTLAYRFNGVTTWTLQSTPNPSGSTESVFQDVSCATETSCTAAGSSVGGGLTQTLAEKWDGTSWSIQGTSNPSGAAFSSLFGVSCRSTTCMGVGWSTDGSGVDTTLAEIRE